MLFQSNTVRVIVSLFIIFLASGIPHVAADNAVIGKLPDRATAGDVNAQFELAEIYYKGENADSISLLLNEVLDQFDENKEFLYIIYVES